MTGFADKARQAFKTAKTFEDFSRAEAFLDDPRFWKLDPGTRVSIRFACAQARNRILGMAAAS